LRGQQPELFVALIDPAIGCVEAVVGNVIPDLGNVLGGSWPAKNTRHLRLRCNLARTARA
jgi:hypothetical protein